MLCSPARPWVGCCTTLSDRRRGRVLPELPDQVPQNPRHQGRVRIRSADPARSCHRSPRAACQGRRARCIRVLKSIFDVCGQPRCIASKRYTVASEASEGRTARRLTTILRAMREGAAVRRRARRMSTVQKCSVLQLSNQMCEGARRAPEKGASVHCGDIGSGGAELRDALRPALRVARIAGSQGGHAKSARGKGSHRSIGMPSNKCMTERAILES
jgi:hypothetical protein